MNVITSILGILTIPFAGYCVFTIDSMGGWDFVLMVIAGAILIYIKNGKFSSLINKMVDKGVIKK